MPDTRVDIEVITDAVRLACRAPSLHNSQPWRWVAEVNSLDLFADRARVVRATDRSGREAIISCGAVLDHLRVAMAAAGWAAHIDRFPNPNNRDHLASIDFGPMTSVTEGHRRRANAILTRRTDRLPFAAPPEWESVEPLLRSIIDGEVVRLDVVADDARPQLAQASELTESLRLYDSFYHTELQWWTAAFAGSEGIPHSSLVSEAESERVDVGRTFPVTRHSERRTHFGRDQSKVLVLSTYDETRESVLRCGEMLSAVLLDATMAGLATCPLTHITELQASRNIVAAVIERDDAVPQVLVRVGIAPSIEDVPPPTGRRPINEVLQIRRGNGHTARSS
ncbi:Acg family FMN-binding oxidoreductase [Mycolicibacterium cosmeticum]|uniref:Acg family FMN-binding oxidoreductase n=1 Tax=Mycolicibacterium cosmeticum TaxID=258533 RepID=UPI0032047EBD